MVYKPVGIDENGNLPARARQAIAASSELSAAFAPLVVRIPDPAQAFPPVASILPAVGAVGSAMASGVDLPVKADNTGPAKWTGPAAIAANGTVTGTTGAIDALRASDAPGVISPSAIRWHFVSDAPKLQFHGSFTGAYLIYVDGELATPSPRVPGGTPYEQIDWNGVRKPRRYRIVAENGFGLASIVTTPADTVYGAPIEATPLIGWMGDSYSQGQGVTSTTFPTNIPYTTAALMGWNLRKSSDGGTGYAQRNGGGNNNFLDRTPQYDGVPLSAMVYAGGINDDATTLQASADAVLARFRQAHPTTPLYVLGPWSPSSTWETNNASKWTALQTVAAKYNAKFIDTHGWITGTGNVSATKGDGNADVNISSDGVHPQSGVGDIYLASRLANAITLKIAGA